MDKLTTLHKWLILALITLLLLALFIYKQTLCCNPPEQDTKIISAYSMLAPSDKGHTLIYGRLIIDGEHGFCPYLVSNRGTNIQTWPRELHPDSASWSRNFPVTVCEAILEPNTRYKGTDGAIRFKAISLAPKKIQIYGDSGCKSKQCSTGPALPFQTLAQTGSLQKPELILHMGDYNYRGTSGSISGDTYAYDAGDGGYGGPTCGLSDVYYSQNAKNSPRPDNWENWYQDFFLPAGPLLAEAPWVFARGNHELCSRAGPGWFYFFGPGSSLSGGIPQQRCPNQGDFKHPPKTARQHIRMIPPYMLKLSQLQLWVMDTTNACDASAASELTNQYRDQYEQLNQQVNNKTTWVISHRPIWGIFNTSGKGSINVMLQSALVKTKAKRLSDKVSLSLAGHMHLYQSLTFPTSAKRPPQLIIGNSGVELEQSNIKGDFQNVPIDKSTASGNELSRFGFMTIKLNDSTDWQAEMYDENGNAWLNCNSENPAQGEMVCKVIDQ